MKTRLLVLVALAALLVPSFATAGRVPPGATPTKTCTRPPQPGELNYLQLCADPATTTVGTNVLVTVGATLNGAPAANGTPLFLYTEGALLASCWTFGGGCSFVLNRTTPATNVLTAYSEGMWSGGVAVTWS